MVKTFDGDYEIIYSNTSNLYEDKLVLKGIEGFNFVFLFQEDKEQKNSGLKVDGDKETNTVTITLTNFRNPLGTATTKKLKIIETEEGRIIYFSIFARSLNLESSFLQVSTTFYLK